jgi:hypothetical protein
VPILSDPSGSAVVAWRRAWVALALALAVHVSDEALTGFLPVYNGVVRGIRRSRPWVLLPTFSFPVWLGGLILGIAVLLAMTPIVSRGRKGMLAVSIGLAVLMVANGLGHVAASVYWGRFAPGVYSSPLLIVAAASLLVAAWRARTVVPAPRSGSNPTPQRPNRAPRIDMK